jgi:hypothetical protein
MTYAKHAEAAVGRSAVTSGYRFNATKRSDSLARGSSTNSLARSLHRTSAKVPGRRYAICPLRGRKSRNCRKSRKRINAYFPLRREGE